MDIIFKAVWGCTPTEHFTTRQRVETPEKVVKEIQRGIKIIKKNNKWMDVASIRASFIIPAGIYKGCRIPTHSSVSYTPQCSKYCQPCQLYFWNTTIYCKACKQPLSSKQTSTSDHKKCPPKPQNLKNYEQNTNNCMEPLPKAKRKMIFNGFENVSKKKKMNPANPTSPTPKQNHKRCLPSKKKENERIQ